MKTKESSINLNNRITVNTETLSKMLDCGKATATKIGIEAGARIKIGNRVLFKVDAIKHYLNQNIE